MTVKQPQIRNSIRKVETAIRNLINDGQIFYASILQQMRREFKTGEEKDCVPARLWVTNTRMLGVNLKECQGLSIRNIENALKHECLHLAHHHFLRFDFSDASEKELANFATDCAINQFLNFSKDCSVVSLKSLEKLCNKKLEPKQDAEYYYNELLKRRDEVEQNMSDEMKELLEQIKSGHKQFKEGKGGKEISDSSSRMFIDSIIAKAIQEQEAWDRKNPGKEKGDSIFKIIPKPVKKWNKKIWEKSINQIASRTLSSNVEYYYGRRSRRHPDTSLWNKRSQLINNNFWFILDTSGSTLSDMEMVINVLNMALKREDATVNLIQCDWDVQDVKMRMKSVTVNGEFQVKGGGGTDLRKGLDYIRENSKGKQQVIVFTDGYTDWYNHPDLLTTVIYTKYHDKLEGTVNGGVVGEN